MFKSFDDNVFYEITILSGYHIKIEAFQNLQTHHIIEVNLSIILIKAMV